MPGWYVLNANPPCMLSRWSGAVCRRLAAGPGAGAGTIGSIVTAFSLNAIIRELNFARELLEITMDAVASDQADIPVFKGLNIRMARASRKGKILLWVGVALLVAGWVLQSLAISFPRNAVSSL